MKATQPIFTSLPLRKRNVPQGEYNLPQGEPSLPELEHTLSQALMSRQHTQLEIAHSQLGDYSVRVEQYQEFSLMQNSYQLNKVPLQLSVEREDPMLLMFFLLQGKADCSGKQFQTQLQSRQQMVNFFPAFQSTMRLPVQPLARDVVVKVSPDLFADILTQTDCPIASYIHRQLQQRQSLPTGANRMGMDAQTVEILQQMRNCPYQGKIREMYLEAQTKLLLLHQFTRLAQAGGDKKIPQNLNLTQSDVEKLHELRLFLEANLLGNYCLPGLSKKFGLNLFKLKYGFKKLFGSSLMKWLDDKKLQYAYQLLQQEDRLVVEVAETLGYSHYNNFSAAFKKKFGYSPQRLRQSA